MSDDGLRRWRLPLTLVGATCATIAVLVVVLRPGGSTSARATSDVQARPGSSSAPPGAIAISPIELAPHASAPASPSHASSVVWPEPSVPIPYEVVKPADLERFGDPFESDAGRPGDVRVLVTVGAFRLGVTLESKVRDEAAVVATLKELGGEIDALDRGRTDSYERRVVEYQSVYERYRPRLQPLMDGAFALKGNGWTDTERVELPTPPDAGGTDAR